MSRIFINYRRDDSFSSATLLRDSLARWLPDVDCFLDTADIEAGADWKSRLESELKRADAVLVVIGRNWTTVADPATARRRLDDPDDVVCWEIAKAMASDKWVIPVLVDGAKFPTQAELPPVLGKLAGLQYREIRHQSYDADIQVLVRALSRGGPPADPARWMRLVRSSLVIVPSAAVVLVSVALLALSERADIWFENRITWIGDSLFDTPLSDKLVVVALRPEADEAEQLRAARREQFAALIDRLVRNKAKAVVLDMTMETPSEFDARLGRSIAGAHSAGTDIVVGYRDIDATTGRAKAIETIEDSGGALGVVCVGDRGASGHNVSYGTLALMRKGSPYTSLPFLAVYGSAVRDVPQDATEIQVVNQFGQPERIPISIAERFDWTSPLCPARSAGSKMLRFIPHISNRALLRRPGFRYEFEDVLRDAGGNNAVFADKVVLVGAEQQRDMLETPLDLAEQRFGFEFQADSINALLTKRIARPIGIVSQAMSIIALGAFAAVIRLSRIGMRRFLGIWLPGFGIIVYCAIVVLAYSVIDLLWKPALPIVAFLVTWVALDVLDRRWTREKR